MDSVGFNFPTPVPKIFQPTGRDACVPTACSAWPAILRAYAPPLEPFKFAAAAAAVKGVL